MQRIWIRIRRDSEHQRLVFFKWTADPELAAEQQAQS
jgi:hypothetical protein